MAKSSSKGVVPEARDALDRFKMEAASEVASISSRVTTAI